MSVADCFNNSTYRDFILVYLIKGKLPRRDYRIRLRSKIIMEHGKAYGEAELVSLEQLTSKGILFSMGAEVFQGISREKEDVRFLIDTEILRECLNKDLAELKSHLSPHALNLLYSSRKEDAVNCFVKNFDIQSSFDFGNSKKLFLFIRYEDFKGLDRMHIIKQFVDHTKSLINDYYRPFSKELKNIA
jgi:hypothetical protein